MSKNKKITEKQKMLSKELFNPADKSFYLMLARAEWLQRRLNNAPLWAQKRRERIFKKLVGSIDGNPYNIFTPLKILYGKNVHIGKNFFSNWNLCLQDYAEIRIGDNVFIGPNVSIVTIHHPLIADERNPRVIPNSMVSGSRGNWQKAFPVHIGNNVLIYTNATICPGVTIGNNSVIGAGSMVTKDIPPNVFACGVPCKVVREITEEDRMGIPTFNE
ncbi:MAG: sugar O-acetyltransferase [Acutalibacteraceae bacterium]|nr:sugar O-acetyltransferase [Acutalibacteraceae bacterium]